MASLVHEISIDDFDRGEPSYAPGKNLHRCQFFHLTRTGRYRTRYSTVTARWLTAWDMRFEVTVRYVSRLQCCAVLIHTYSFGEPCWHPPSKQKMLFYPEAAPKYWHSCAKLHAATTTKTVISSTEFSGNNAERTRCFIIDLWLLGWFVVNIFPLWELLHFMEVPRNFWQSMPLSQGGRAKQKIYIPFQ